jgi:hypothetical protein
MMVQQLSRLRIKAYQPATLVLVPYDPDNHYYTTIWGLHWFLAARS